MASAWDKQPGESAQAFEAKRMYLKLGASRSIVKVVQESGKDKALLERWSVRWGWVAAANAYDAEMAAIEDRAMMAERERIATRLERLRWQLPGREMDAAASLRDKALRLLELPHVRKTAKDDKTGEPITIKPAHAAEFRAAGDLMFKADDLERRALGLPALVAKFDLAGLDGEQLRLIAAMMLGDDDAGETRQHGRPLEGDLGARGAQSNEVSEGDSSGESMAQGDAASAG